MRNKLVPYDSRRRFEIGDVFVHLWFAVALALLIPCQPVSATEPGSTKNVLVLKSFSDRSVDPIDALTSELRARVPWPVDLYVEYLESRRFDDQSYERGVAEILKHTYAGQKLDLVMAVSYPALAFALRHRDELFPLVPIVFYGVDATRIAGQKMWPGVTGLTVSCDVRGTIDLALHLHPDTNTVAVITNNSEFERYWLAIVHKELIRLQGKVKEVDLVALPTGQLLDTIAALPLQTVVLFQESPQDSIQPVFTAYDVLAWVGQRRPTYCIFPVLCLNHGGIGGVDAENDEQGRLAAEVAGRVLSGERPENIPVVNGTAQIVRVDWRQLRHWNIPESELPPGSLVLYRESTIWQRYKRYIIGSICLILAQTLLILALLWHREKRRKVEKSLVERLAFETLLSDLSTTFINLPDERVDASIEESLGRIAEFLGIDQVTLHELARDTAESRVPFAWRAERHSLLPPVLKFREFPWWIGVQIRGEVILTAGVNALPEEASAEREYLRKMGVISLATVPLKVSGEIFGSMSFASTQRRVLWTDDLLQQLKMLAEIFSNALKRKHATHALLLSNAELKKSEIVLRESEERFRLVADTAPALIWMSGTNNLCTFFNQGWLSFTGRSMDQEQGEGWLAEVHPDDQERRLAIFPAGSDAPVEFEVEYRLRRFDGEYRWIVDHGVPRFGSDGIFCGYIGSCVDITDRKTSELSLRELSGRLIHAQEEERARIARELHDDLSQRIVLLSISLEQFGQGRPGLSSADREQLRNIEQVATEVSSTIHNLSHQLHPYKLDSLGLGPSLRGLCREFSSQHHMQVEFIHQDVPADIPKNVSLCLFRIAQEGLRNAMKYSGTAEARVELSADCDGIELCISDSGVGFDPETAKREGGLGLISIRERLRLVSGNLSIESKPLRGARIRARVPISRMTGQDTSEQKQYEARA